jgi:uncharacterized repeat protein (TIGR01451 family)
MLALTKTSSPRVVQTGQAISYTLQVTNAGEAEALDVRVCDTPPSGVSVTSAPGFQRSGGSICTTISSLLPLASRTFHLTAKANPGTHGTITNHATASARNAATVRASAPNVVPAPPPSNGTHAHPPAHQPPTKPPPAHKPPPAQKPPAQKPPAQKPPVHKPPKPPSVGVGKG